MSVAEQREEVQRVLHSQQFRRSPKLQRFLELICDYHFNNKSDEISEFLIATQAFGKGDGFDPSQDSLVRVQAREARRRLREYYNGEGAGSTLVLDIPSGRYAPLFTSTESAPLVTDVPAPVSPAPSPKQRLWQSFKMPATVLTATAMVCSVALFVSLREHRPLIGTPGVASAASIGAARPQVSRLWNRFLESDVPTVLVLSNPLVGDDPECQATGAPAPSKALAEGPCPDEYTGMGEAVAIHILTNLFKSARQTLVVKQSRMVTADDSKRYNLILLGGKKVNVWVQRLGDDLSLAAKPEDLTISPSFGPFETVIDHKTGQLVKDRATIALRRNPATGRWLLFLFGRHTQGTQAAAEASTDEQFLSRLKWPGSGAPFPDSFRVLIGVKINDGIPGAPAAVLVNAP